jgi:hypothetical protein
VYFIYDTLQLYPYFPLLLLTPPYLRSLSHLSSRTNHIYHHLPLLLTAIYIPTTTELLLLFLLLAILPSTYKLASRGSLFFHITCSRIHLPHFQPFASISFPLWIL